MNSGSSHGRLGPGLGPGLCGSSHSPRSQHAPGGGTQPCARSRGPPLERSRSAPPGHATIHPEQPAARHHPQTPPPRPCPPRPSRQGYRVRFFTARGPADARRPAESPRAAAASVERGQGQLAGEGGVEGGHTPLEEARGESLVRAVAGGGQGARRVRVAGKRGRGMQLKEGGEGRGGGPEGVSSGLGVGLDDALGQIGRASCRERVSSPV